MGTAEHRDDAGFCSPGRSSGCRSVLTLGASKKSSVTTVRDSVDLAL